MKNLRDFKSFKKTTNKKFISYPGPILILGFGSVGQAILPLIMRHIDIDPADITVLEKDNHRKLFNSRYGSSGVKYVMKEIKPNNLDSTLSKYVSEGGFIIDVSLNIDAEAILKWCFENGVHYINTSLERWPHEPDETIPKLADRTLYHTHQEIRKFAKKYKNAATVAVTSGANPGLVTHLTKRALLKIASSKGINVDIPEDKEQWAQLMKKLGVEVVHVAERDTQIIDVPKQKNEFVGTWSVEGLWAEGRAPSELGYGTHEKPKLENGTIQNTAAFLHQPGLTVLCKSWVPEGGSYNGFLIQHSEAITISEYFSTKDGSFNPSVYYVYQPCDATIASIHELRGHELEMPFNQRIIKDEIISGMDELGVLLITRDKVYWHGSQLNIDEARKLIPGENATSVQVVANMLGTIMYCLENPNLGYIEPEQIPFDYVLNYADPYLGPVPFVESDWRPEEDKNSLFYRPFDKKYPNCLDNFRVWS